MVLFLRWLKFIAKVVLVIVLTLLTQIGGLAYLISIGIGAKVKYNFRGKAILVFLLVYLSLTFLIVPWLAPLFGRERVNNTERISSANYMTILLNRNYVKPALNDILKGVSEKLSAINPAIHITYLDANFPFLDGFALLPHLSHNDGKKIDLAFIYETKDGVFTNAQKSMSGYGLFEEPKTHEYNQISICKSKGYFQYDYAKYLTFGEINNGLKFSDSATKQLIDVILEDPRLDKMFIEPHLKTRLKLTSSKVRFHGCRAVRHDDHIHIQL